MLFYKAIESKALELLKKLMQMDILTRMRLVGGTSLALQIGHRKSVDLDLFGTLDADQFSLTENLSRLGEISILKRTTNINIFEIEGIKVDVVNFRYPWLEEVSTVEEIRLAGKKDIAAMKMSAITGRGTKKDFVDLYYLLKLYTLEEMLAYYREKYADGSEFLVLKSLTYFEDADNDADVVMLKPIEWHDIKRHIVEETEKYLGSLS